MAGTEHLEHLEHFLQDVAEPDMRTLKMVRQILSLAALSAVLLVAGSCRSRTDKPAGPVILTFGNITGIPLGASVAPADAVGRVSTGTLTFLSIVTAPTVTLTPPIEALT